MSSDLYDFENSWSLQSNGIGDAVTSFVSSWTAESVAVAIGNTDDVYPGAWVRNISFDIYDKDGNVTIGGHTASKT